jgi:ABC-type dipeptide/oligopeptide/nickel transport system permease component
MSHLGPRSKHYADQVIYFFDLFPLFGWALLAMILFASGSVFSWFPSHISASTLNGFSFWSRSVWPFVLPVFVLWVSTFPFVTKHIDNAFQKSAGLPFVFMARARGLSEQTVKRKYRLRYSLLPAVTLFGEYLLAVVSGALVVEVLFSIQGVGMLLTESVSAQDYPVVTGIILLLIVVRMASYLITDIMYYWMDPRIRLSSK